MASDFDPLRDYPLGARRSDLVSTPSGRPLDEITLDALREGSVEAGDMRATSATLTMQAEVARAAGREPLAASLERAAELAAVPDDVLLAVYTALRPRRTTGAELERWAEQLDAFGALRAAAFVREAASVYADRGLLADA